MRRGRSTGNPTKAEAARIVGSKFGACIPCLVWAEKGKMPPEDVAEGGDYQHSTSGGIRRGHKAGYCDCGWHHRGIVGEGWTREQMRAHFGPSLMDGSKLYRAAYGTEDELIARQSAELEAAA